MTGDCCVFKFLRRSVDGKHLMRFQSENSVFNSSDLVWTGRKLFKPENGNCVVIKVYLICKQFWFISVTCKFNENMFIVIQPNCCRKKYIYCHSTCIFVLQE